MVILVCRQMRSDAGVRWLWVWKAYMYPAFDTITMQIMKDAGASTGLHVLT